MTLQLLPQARHAHLEGQEAGVYFQGKGKNSKASWGELLGHKHGLR